MVRHFRLSCEMNEMMMNNARNSVCEKHDEKTGYTARLAAQCIVIGPVCGFVCVFVGVFVGLLPR